MAEYISFQPSDFFNTTIWTGNSTDDRAITGLGFAPNFVWIKDRTTSRRHDLFDTTRGATYKIESSDSDAQAVETDSLKSFDADGYTLGTGSPVNSSSTYVGWSWKAGTTTGIAGSPSITPLSYSFNATSGFSVIKYTGNATAGATLPHGLGVAPEMILVKNLDEVMDWVTYNKPLGNTDYMVLNTTIATAASITRWNNTTPGATLFTIGDTDKINSSGIDYVAYCFAPKKGYSKFGQYAGTGDATISPFIYTGFRPNWIMIKRSDVQDNWQLYDSKREGYNEDNDYLKANSTGEEEANVDIDILSNGFKMRTTDAAVNASGGSSLYCYAAFAEFPLVSSNDVPTVAR